MNLALAYRLLLSSILSYGVHSSDKTWEMLRLDPILMPATNIQSEYIKDSGFKDEKIWFCQSQSEGEIDAFLYLESTNEIVLAFRGTALPAKLELNIRDVWTRLANEKLIKFDTQALLKQFSFSLTDSLRVVYDWNNNFKADATKDKQFGLPGKIHEGFLKSLRNLWIEKSCKKNLRQIFSEVVKAKVRGKKLYFAGHSKGGALAQLAAAVFAKKDFKSKPNGVFTFGSPRVGTQEFARFYNTEFPGNSWRFEFRNDIVPHVPLSIPLIENKTSELLERFNISVFRNLGLNDAYVSVGQLVYIESEEANINEDVSRLAQQRMENLHYLITHGKFLDPILDHAPFYGTSYHGFLRRYK